MTRCKDIKTPKQGMYKTFQNMWSKGYLQNCNAPNLTAKKLISISHWQINQLIASKIYVFTNHNSLIDTVEPRYKGRI